MNKQQQKSFINYLNELGATIEKTYIGEMYRGARFMVDGLGVRVTFDDVYYLPNKDRSSIFILEEAKPSGLPSHIDRGARVELDMWEKERDYTKIEIRRKTFEGGYRYTVKEQIIKRRAAPLRALAAEFVAMQQEGLPLARTWTHDNIDRFTRSVEHQIDLTTLDRSSALSMAYWLSYNQKQKDALSALNKEALSMFEWLSTNKTAPPLEAYKRYEEARKLWEKLEDPEDFTVNALVLEG
jgi:hypothetical protein